MSVDFIAAPPAPAPNRDADGDGYVGSQFGGPDCNDANAGVHPTAVDVPHDGIDEDCNGRDAAWPRVPASVLLGAIAHRTFTKVTRLPVSRAPIGATVVVTCSPKAKGCPFARKTYTVRSSRTLQLARLFQRARLRPGARVTVTVTAPRSIGSVVRFLVLAGRAPKRSTLCIEPGATKPQKSCS